MQIAGVVLAAGRSTRFGSPKQLARIGERSMLEAVADLALGAGLHPVLAVVPAGMAVPPDVVPVVNEAPEDGLSRSLRLGLAAVPHDADGAVVLLGDQPTLARETILAVLAAARADRPVVAARANGRLAPPVLLLRDAFSLADEAGGDAGLGPWLAGHPDLVAAVEVASHAPDVDTRRDLERVT